MTHIFIYFLRSGINDPNETNDEEEYHLVEVVEDHQYSKSLPDNTDDDDSSDNVSPDNGVNYLSVGSKEYDDYFRSYKKLKTKTESSSRSETTPMKRSKCDSDTVPIENNKEVHDESKEVGKSRPTDKQTGDIVENPVDTFFRSMATTVKSFSPQLIAETRMKVCNIVSEMELRSLSECNAQSQCTFKHSPKIVSSPISICSLSPTHIKDEIDSSFEID